MQSCWVLDHERLRFVGKHTDRLRDDDDDVSGAVEVGQTRS